MFNIRAPGAPGEALLKGFDTGSSHMARLLHNKMQQAQMQQQQEHFLQNFGLQQAQENRAQQQFPLEMQNTLAQTQYHQAQAAQLAQKQKMFQMLLQELGQGGQMGGNEDSMNIPTQGQIPQTGQIRNNSFDIENRALTGNPDRFHNLRQNPFLAGMMKKEFGVDLNSQSPEQKQQMDLQTHSLKKKLDEQAKSNEDLTRPTLATVTDAQEVINAANSVLPLLKKLKEGKSFSSFAIPSAEKSKYKTRAGLSTDKMIKALKLSKDKESTNLVKQMTHKEFAENDKEFQDRVQLVIDEIEDNASLANQVINNKKVSPSMTKEEAETVKKKYETKSPAKIIRYNSKTGKYE